MSRREFRADVLLSTNIRALLRTRGLDDQALAIWCGHKPAWISKILNGERGVKIRDLGKIADFFGLTVAELFQHGIDPLTERRKAERRSGTERRIGQDRRQPLNGRLHPDALYRAFAPNPHSEAADSDEKRR